MSSSNAIKSNTTIYVEPGKYDLGESAYSANPHVLV